MSKDTTERHINSEGKKNGRERHKGKDERHNHEEESCAPESARARGLGISQGIDRPAWDGLGPKSKRWHPERVAAVPFLRNGEGKKSPLRRLPTDHRESLTQTMPAASIG